MIDTVIAMIQGVRVIYAATQTDSDYEDFPISRGADIGIGLTLMALFGASAGHGFSQTDRCQDMQSKLSGGRRERTVFMGCTRDDQCKGDRICEAGRCVAPPSAALPAPTTESAAASAPAAPERAFGYGFGVAVQDAEQACVAAGGALVATAPDLYECRTAGAPAANTPVVALRFCGAGLCEVVATFFRPDPPELHAWVQSYDQLRADLRARLGAPVQEQRALDDVCATDVRACFASATTTFHTLWRWSDGAQVWLHSTRNAELVLSYTAASAATPQ